MLIKNARYIVTQNKNREILENADIVIEDGKIAEIGKNLRKDGEVFDASNKIVIPGLINSHTHLPMSLFKGVSDTKNLHDWLENYIAPLEAKLNDEIAYHGAMLGILEGMSSGTTTFCDMYSYTDSIIKAVEKSGVRAFVGSGLKDGNDESKAQEEIRRAKNIVSKVEKSCGHTKPLLGLHWTLTCSDELIQRLVEMNAAKIPIHMHVSETPLEIRKNMEIYGRRPVERLSSLGALGTNFVAVHAVHINGKEIELLRKSGSSVVYNPSSNMKLADGVCPVVQLRERGVRVALGTDSSASNDNLNMFSEMKIASLLQKVASNNASVASAQEMLDMATIDAAKAIGADALIGSIESGKLADLVLIDKDDVTMNPLYEKRNLVKNLVYSFSGNVSDVIVNGKFLLNNYRTATISKVEIIRKANEIMLNELSSTATARLKRS